jgi:radical SAM superfamily enzyme
MPVRHIIFFFGSNGNNIKNIAHLIPQSFHDAIGVFMQNTDLAKDYTLGKFRCLELEEYAQWLDACLEVLPDNIILHRITGDGAKRDLIAPLWSADKKRVLNYLNRNLKHK